MSHYYIIEIEVVNYLVNFILVIIDIEVLIEDVLIFGGFIGLFF